MPLTRSAARARRHRALSSDDVLSTVLSFLDPLASFGAATACKTLRDAWRRRCRGMLRVHGQLAGEFSLSDRIVVFGDGVLVATSGPLDGDGRGRDPGCLRALSADGTHQLDLNVGLDNPRELAFRGDGTAWVFEGPSADTGVISCVVLAELSSGVESDVLMRIDVNQGHDDSVNYVMAIALADDALLVLCLRYELGSDGHAFVANAVRVYDNQTGAFLREFVCVRDEGRRDEYPSCMAVQGDRLYIACTLNNAIDEYDWREGTRLRSFLGGDKGFSAPYGIAVRGKTLYVSSDLTLEANNRILVMRLHDDSSKPEILQIIPSPDGGDLGGLGLCVNGDRLWCMESRLGPSPGEENYGRGLASRGCLHLLGPCYE